MILKYVPGKTLQIPDALSRAPLKTQEQPELADIEYTVHAIESNIPASNDAMNEFKTLSQTDTSIQKIKTYLIEGWTDVVNKCDPEIRHYYGFRDELSENNGMVYKGQQLVVPTAMKSRIMKSIHEGHQGISKSIIRAKMYFYWPAMNKEITDMVNKCSSCQEHRNCQPKEPNIQMTGDGPWHTIGCDLFHVSNHHYIIATDYYSSYPEVIYLKSGRAHGTSLEVISRLKYIFSCHGIPFKVISDGGPQFDSREFAKFAKDWNFIHEFSSPHYPRGNGRAERSVQTVKDLITKAVNSKQDVQRALLAYRSTPLADCNKSPSELLMNRTLRTPLNAHKRVK